MNGRKCNLQKMRIAIVEDSDQAARVLHSCLLRYEKEYETTIDAVRFGDVASFLSGYKPEYDCVFMDIDLPCRNGLEGAKKLRECDPWVPLVFVTALAHYAVDGYRVGATDYLVKPYSYTAFKLAMTAVVKKTKTANEYVTVRNLEGSTRIPVDSIYYVEVNKHRVIYHTDFGCVDVWGSMKSAEELLPKDVFAKCGASWLVNLRYVRGISGTEVTVGSDRIKISRAKKKEFTASLHNYMSRDGGV